MSKLSIESFTNLYTITGDIKHTNDMMVNRNVLKQLILDSNRYRWLREADNDERVTFSWGMARDERLDSLIDEEMILDESATYTPVDIDIVKTATTEPIIRINNDGTAIVTAKPNYHPLSNIPHLSNALSRLQFSGLVLFDLLAVNGLAPNRFCSMQFVDGKFDRSTFTDDVDAGEIEHEQNLMFVDDEPFLRGSVLATDEVKEFIKSVHLRSERKFVQSVLARKVTPEIEASIREDALLAQADFECGKAWMAKTGGKL